MLRDIYFLYMEKYTKGYKGGFSLMEILIVIGIIAILASVVMPSLRQARHSALYVKALQETKSFATALEAYIGDNGTYPDDLDREVPDLGDFFTGANLTTGPWPGSVYDWDNINDPITGDNIYRQLSIRFCEVEGDDSTCTNPSESWAEDFDSYSSVYYCISGSCRAHKDQPEDHPGYCFNCVE